MTFSSRYLIYGANKAAVRLSDKTYLHSYLNIEGAREYVRKHKKLFPNEHECYDILVGTELKERIE